MIDGTKTVSKVDAGKLTLLFRMLMSQDPDEHRVGVKAIRGISPDDLAEVLSDPELSSDVLDYFARHAGSRTDWIEALKKNPSLTEELRGVLETSPLDSTAGKGVAQEAAAKEDPGLGHLSKEQRIRSLRVGEKIKMALKGDKETRTILLKDTNREVYMAVLENPGIKDSELELLAKNTGTNSEILRVVGRNREWTSNRNLVKSLIFNSKTPVDVSIRFLSRLSLKELELIDKGRSLPSALRANAKRLIAQKRKSR
ncbi:MAG: hypothetical protein ACC669_10005 [bacterium]